MGNDKIDIGSRNQVFLDGRLMEETINVSINVQKPRKTGEKNIVSDLYTYARRGSSPIAIMSVEGKKELNAYSQVMEYDGTFKDFNYVSKNGSEWNLSTPELLDSGDFSYGLRLCSRPALGWPEGTPHLDYENVFADPNAEAEEKYKIVSAWQNKIFASKDGTDWKLIGAKMFPDSVYAPYPDAMNIVFFDDSIAEYVAYIRHQKLVEIPPKYKQYFSKQDLLAPMWEGKRALRSVARLTSQDLRYFSEPKMVLQPDENDPVMDGVPVMDFHSPTVMKYGNAQDAYVMYSHPFLHYKEWYISDDLSHYWTNNGQTPINCGSFDIRIAGSSDGINWEQYDRKPVIPLEMDNDVDTSLWPVYGMICKADEIWAYYISSPTQNLPENGFEFRTVMSRVIFRKDGFTALEAPYSGGEFTTRTLGFDGNELQVNAETSSVGLIRIEIQDEKGIPLEGYRLEECDRVYATNTTKKTVSWNKGKSDVSRLSGLPIRLRFELLFGAKVYSFKFGNAGTSM